MKVSSMSPQCRLRPVCFSFVRFGSLPACFILLTIHDQSISDIFALFQHFISHIPVCSLAFCALYSVIETKTDSKVLSIY